MLPVFVASGCWASSFTQAYRILSATDVSGVFLKTATLNPRKGNGLPNYVREDDATFNRMGLPNGGIDHIADIVRQIRYGEYASFVRHKTVGVSVAYEDPNSFSEILERISAHTDVIDTVEVNMSCPNLGVTGIKGVVGYDTFNIQLACIAIDGFCEREHRVRVGMKLPPYFDTITANKVGDIIGQSNRVEFITTCNSIPNLIQDVQQPLVMGGSGSSINKAVGLSNVFQMRRILPSRIGIYGCGGIRNAMDVYEYISAGADYVQIASGFLSEDKDASIEMDIVKINKMLVDMLERI